MQSGSLFDFAVAHAFQLVFGLAQDQGLVDAVDALLDGRLVLRQQGLVIELRVRLVVLEKHKLRRWFGCGRP